MGENGLAWKLSRDCRILANPRRPLFGGNVRHTSVADKDQDKEHE